MQMSRVDVTIATRDGTCPASIFTPPDKSQPWPAVILFMDGFGVRPVMNDMARRLADGGYLVLLPDLYYRFGQHRPRIPSKVLTSPALLQDLMRFVTSLSYDRKTSDVAAFIDFLLARSDVEGERFGATGYGLGGNVALTAAGAFPERFAAVASIHACNLVTEEPESPHRHVSGLGGYVYVAGASNDGHFSEGQKNNLEEALSSAGVDHLIEVYAGALPGFAVPDMPAFSVEAAERHWTVLFKLFHDVLKVAQ
jgi:carboxymethylenebutenolidase